MPTACKHPAQHNLVLRPTGACSLSTFSRGAVLTVERRSRTQYPFMVEMDGHNVSEGVSPSLEHAQTAAAVAAVEVAGGG